MKIFVISDIHGNEFALKEILKCAEKEHPDLILCAGDLSGYFSGINEVITLLQDYKVKCILGNHDVALIGKIIPSVESIYYDAFIKSKNCILPSSLDWLKSLNSTESYQLNDSFIKMYHGGPSNLLDQLVSPIDIFSYPADFQEAKVYIFGHSHLPFIISNNGRLFINPGTVGLPRNGDFRAHGVVYDLTTGNYKTYRLPYDLNEFNMKYSGGQMANEKLLHNTNFGRSSNKKLQRNSNLFSELAKEIQNDFVDAITIASEYGISITFQNELIIYAASYSDGTYEITSNTLLYNWQIKMGQKNMLKTKMKEIKQNKVGYYFSMEFLSKVDFKKYFSKTLKNVLSEITMEENEYL